MELWDLEVAIFRHKQGLLITDSRFIVRTSCPTLNFPIDRDSLPAPNFLAVPSHVKFSVLQLDGPLPFLMERHRSCLRFLVALFNSA